MASGLSISVKTNASEYAAVMRVRAESLIKSAELTGDEIGAIALERAKWWSSGPYKQKELNRLGHPYAKRHHEMKAVTTKRSGSYERVSKYAKAMRIGEGYPSRINLQTGDFAGGWNWTHVRKVGTGDMVGTLSNSSEHARYLTQFGTTYMVPRPVMQAIARDVRKRAVVAERKLFPRAMKRDPLSKMTLSRMRGSGVRDAFRGGFQRGLAMATAVGGI